MTQSYRPPGSSRGVLGGVERGCDWLFTNVARACGWVLVLLALLITFDIILRELRTAGIIDFNWQFVAEWSTFLVMLVVFAGLAYTLRSNGHITVSLLVERFSPRWRCVSALAMAIVSEAVLLYMVYRGTLWMMLSIRRDITSTSVLKTPMWIPNLFVVLGLAMFAVAILLFIIRTAQQALAGADSSGGNT